MTDEQFMELTRKQLNKIADEFAVDVKDVKNKTELVERLVDEGVTYEEYEKMQQAVEAQQAEESAEQVKEPEVPETELEADPEPEEQTFLVKMERQNPSYDAVGKTFTSEHPFMVCTKEEVDRLMYEHTGFRMATPQEVEQYYS